jgi:predicted alpha/beta superfamily hydrolase
MKRLTIIILFTVMFFSLTAKGQTVCCGRTDRITIASPELKESRTIDVWLPEGYDTTRKYAVIYMHDGQMLFDSTTTWNRQEWGADEVTSELMARNKIKRCIIVGIWNKSEDRYSEYFPEKALDGISKWRRARITHRMMGGKALGDEYLAFLVNEVKPYIDSHYSTYTDRDNTLTIGSSMGGLISLYALCEYPEVFGGAGCLSSHLVMIGPNFLRKHDNSVARAFRKYLAGHLPDPASHRIYCDHGTATLDKWYGPYQQKVDRVISDKGYTGKNFMTVTYEGQDHSERSWRSRLDRPMVFLLGR